MLPKINRLQSTKDIERVFKEGKGLRGGFMSLKFLKNGLGASRFAFIVSKKVSKKAVQRNKTKRILRDIIQKRIPRMKVGLDLVIIAQKGAEIKGFQEAEREMDALLRGLKLWD